MLFVPTAAVGAVGVPVKAGDAAGASVVLHVKPVPLTQLSAFAPPLQLGIENAVGLALDPVAFASTVFAAMAAIPFMPMPPHAGAVPDPVETMACPLDEPDGLRSVIGLSVVPNAMLDTSASDAPRSFKDFPIFIVR